jgi:prevent-host-death family protein
MVPLTVSATKAKLKFGALMVKVQKGQPVIIEKNDEPAMVWISLDDYEDFLEVNDKKFQKSIEKSAREIKAGKYSTLDDLYEIHKKAIAREAKRHV